MAFFYSTSYVSSGALSNEDTLSNNVRIGHNNLALAGTAIADSSDAAYPVINLSTPNTYQFWRSAVSTDQGITFTLGPHSGVDYLAIAGHNFKGGAVTVAIKTKTLVGDAWTTIFSATALTGAEPFVLQFASTTNKYFQIYLHSTAGAIPQIANVFIGKMLVFPRRIFVGHKPLSMSREALVSRASAENGQFMGSYVRSRAFETDVTVSNLKTDFYLSYILPFQVDAETKPFIWCWRPTSYANDVYFSWLTGNLKPSQKASKFIDLSFSLRGMFYE